MAFFLIANRSSYRRGVIDSKVLLDRSPSWRVPKEVLLPGRRRAEFLNFGFQLLHILGLQLLEAQKAFQFRPWSGKFALHWD